VRLLAVSLHFLPNLGGMETAAAAICAALARREKPGHGGRLLRLGVHAHAAHHVVARRADFHRRRRDIDVRQLLELVVHAGQLLLDVIGRAARRDIEENTAVWTTTSLANLSANGPRHDVAREQFGRPTRRRTLAGGHRRNPAIGFLFSFRELALKHFGDVIEHEPPALAVQQHAPLAAHAFGDERAANARRPDHAGRMKLHELHVDQVGPGPQRHGMPVGRVLPRVGRDLPAAADSARCEHDCLRPEHDEPPALALVAETARYAPAAGAVPPVVGENPADRAFHVHVDALVYALVLQRADHLQAGAIAHVRQPRICVAAEIPLQNAAVARAIEDRAPFLQLANAGRRLLGMNLRHPPLIEELAAAHRVAEMHFPVVPRIDVGERGRNSPFGHYRMSLSQQRLAHERGPRPERRRLNRRPQPGPARADDHHVVFKGLILIHESLLVDSG